MSAKQPEQVVGDIVARDVDDLGLNACFSQSLLLEVQGVRIVDLEIGNAGRLLAHPTGVQAGTGDDDLLAAPTELLVQSIVEIARAEPDASTAWRKTRGNALGCAPRPLAEK